MTEIEFEKAVVELAHMFDWRVASFRPAQTGKGWRTPVKYDGKGYPDLTLVHVWGYIIFAELKTDTGRVSDEQQAWGEALRLSVINIGATDEIKYEVWRPRDSNHIAATLSFGRVTDWRLGQPGGTQL